MDEKPEKTGLAGKINNLFSIIDTPSKQIIVGIYLIIGFGTVGALFEITRRSIQSDYQLHQAYNSVLVRCADKNYDGAASPEEKLEFSKRVYHELGISFIEGDYPRYATGEAVRYAEFKSLMEGYCTK